MSRSMLSVLEQSPWRLRLRADSNPALLRESRRRVEQFAAEAGFDEQVTGEIGLCVNEAMSNIIRHAYAPGTDGPIEVTAWVEGRELRVSLRDWGCGRDPSAKLADAPRDPLRPGGVGLVCLKSLMDEVIFSPQVPGMLLTLVRRR